MSYSVEIADAAENDIREAFLWYEDQKEKLGSVFQDHVCKAMDSIRNAPLKTQIRYGGTRIFFLNKFQYGIHFLADENQNTVLVLAGLHTSQDPVKWTKR